MRPAKIIKRTLAFLLAFSLFFTSMNFYEKAYAKNQDTSDEDTSTYFKANVFDYDQSTVNQETLDSVADALLQEGFDKSPWSSEFKKVYEEKKALLFTNCGGGSNVVSKPYYYGNYYGQSWTESISDYLYLNEDNAPYNICRYNDIYQGLVKDRLGEDGLPVFNCYTSDLFNPDVTGNKSAAYKDVDVEFKYDSQSGYYVLDSSKYTYRLNDSHDRINSQSGQEFWIFGSGNTHFGMSLAVDFAMTEDGKYNGQDCKFEFMGDDDVWVYVDDKLAIDLGGIHDSESAYIDFANRQVVYTYHDGSKESKVSFENLGLEVNDNQLHSLKVFYLERGAGNSNCKIKFNMPTVNDNDDITGDFTFVKENSSAKTPVEGAGFTLYSDEDCSQKVAEAVSGKDGLVSFKELKTGQYYLVETGTPAGYKTSEVSKYKVTIAGNSKDNLIAILYAWGDKGWAKVNDYDGNYPVIYNIPEDQVSLNKTATLVNWEDRTYQITLDATAIKESTIVSEEVVDKPVDVVLVLDTSYSMYFPANLVSYESNGKALDKSKEYYFVDESQSADVYRLYYSGGRWLRKNALYNHVNGYNNASRVTETYKNGKYTYKVGNTTISQFYTADKSMAATRFAMLQSSAKSFINKLSEMSDKSRVSIVYFNSDEYGTLKDFTSLDAEGESSLTTAIGGVDNNGNLTGSLKNHIGSGTNQSAGMKAASQIIGDDTSENDKYVVLLTDGCPTVDGVDNAINGKSGYGTKLKKNGVKIISIGVDVHEEYMSSAVKLLNNTASFVKDSDTEKYSYITESAKLDDIFGILSGVIRNESSERKILPGKVVDIIDSRFEIADTDQEALKEATIVVNEDGTTTLTWNSDALNGWVRSFDIKAKKDYAGGNNVSTNDSASGIYVENEFLKFPEPKVNVKINLGAGTAEAEIFLGQTLKDYFTVSQLQKLFSENQMDCRDLDLSFSWDENGSIQSGSLEKFRQYIRSLAPESDTSYELNITAVPKTADNSKEALAAAELMKNSDNGIYTASMEKANQYDVSSVSQKGIYNVKVISGQIQINKSYDLDHLSGLGYSKAEKKLIDARQSAVFTVYRYAEDTSADDILQGRAEAIESYQLVIEGNGSKTITGLRAGVYRVLESSWTWKYGRSNISEEDSTDDGIMYIGKENPKAEAQQKKTVSFENIMTEEGIYSDTTGVTNVFK